MKIQIKKDEVSKYTKLQNKFKKNLYKMLMQRENNKFLSCEIKELIEAFDNFEPLLDWYFHPVCGCELTGIDLDYCEVKHNNLFGKHGHLLHEECLYAECGSNSVYEGYEMWVLDNMKIVFTYYCTVEDNKTGLMMTYRYPLGKKIPADMELGTADFLSEISKDIFSIHNPM